MQSFDKSQGHYAFSRLRVYKSYTIASNSATYGIEILGDLDLGVLESLAQVGVVRLRYREELLTSSPQVGHLKIINTNDLLY